MVGCGAFDLAALNNFGYPAAKIKPAKGSCIATIEDFLCKPFDDYGNFNNRANPGIMPVITFLIVKRDGGLFGPSSETGA